MLGSYKTSLEKNRTPEFDLWWKSKNNNHGTRIKTNADFVESIWGNPWMKVFAMEIFNAGMKAK